MVVVLASKDYPASHIQKEKTHLTIDTSFIKHSHSCGYNDFSRWRSGYIWRRVLGAVGTGISLDDAKNAAYQLCDVVNFPSKYYRKDIGHREFSRQ